jgi:hypothetical protein
LAASPKKSSESASSDTEPERTPAPISTPNIARLISSAIQRMRR